MRKTGISITALAKEFKISKSTVSTWVRNIELPEELRKHLSLNSVMGREKGFQIMKARREIEQKKIQAEAEDIVSTVNILNKNLARFLAALIFWCEGSKRHLSTLKFTNSDPKLIRLFLGLLRTGFDIDESKLRCLMHLHGYHKQETQLKFWSGITRIPKKQFNRSFRKQHTAIRTRENYQGCVTITYFDAKVARKLDAIYHTLANIGP